MREGHRAVYGRKVVSFLPCGCHGGLCEEDESSSAAKEAVAWSFSVEPEMGGEAGEGDGGCGEREEERLVCPLWSRRCVGMEMTVLGEKHCCLALVWRPSPAWEGERVEVTATDGLKSHQSRQK
jgi:hypothetical protein